MLLKFTNRMASRRATAWSQTDWFQKTIPTIFLLKVISAMIIIKNNNYLAFEWKKVVFKMVIVIYLFNVYELYFSKIL